MSQARAVQGVRVCRAQMGIVHRTASGCAGGLSASHWILQTCRREGDQQVMQRLSERERTRRTAGRRLDGALTLLAQQHCAALFFPSNCPPRPRVPPLLAPRTCAQLMREDVAVDAKHVPALWTAIASRRADGAHAAYGCSSCSLLGLLHHDFPICRSGSRGCFAVHCACVGPSGLRWHGWHSGGRERVRWWEEHRAPEAALGQFRGASGDNPVRTECQSACSGARPAGPTRSPALTLRH